MNKRVFTVVFLLIFNFLNGQEEAHLISMSDFDNRGAIVLDRLNNWVFLSTTETQIPSSQSFEEKGVLLNPNSITPKLYDEDGYFQGWFRLVIRMDETMRDQRLYFHKESRETSELYINEELFHTYGSFGESKEAAQSYNFSNRLPLKVELEPGRDYTIHIRFLDHTTFYAPKSKFSLAGSIPFLAIVDQSVLEKQDKHYDVQPVYQTIWITVCSLLVLFFWFLVFQNPNENNLKWVAVCSTLWMLICLMEIFAKLKGISFQQWRFSQYGFFFLVFCNLAYIPVMVARIFNGSIPKVLKVGSFGIITMGIINVLFLSELYPMGIAILYCAITCIYLIVTFRKSLYGAQWAIVVGISATSIVLGFQFLKVVLDHHFFGQNSWFGSPIHSSLIYLLFPLSLLVYVGRRFKEMVQDVEIKSRAVVQAIEEKRTLLREQNETLERQVSLRTSELSESLDQLKATQSQLIQSEKMASLGELTAGIAHEIQNPLNFVNNFSDVSGELLEEAIEELDNKDIDEAKEILEDLKGNLEKISHHGGRASGIVKGMLAHSRESSGVKELTDINALCDEYIRLSYHGLRAKDKSFEAAFDLDLDDKLSKIEVIPQDIGRVLLNLFNNAFQAVNERSKTEDEVYEPSVIVKTGKEGKSAFIKVLDNGFGIEDQIKDKVFQPFFTTKETGQGTGLGLSLSYDIVKTHNGNISIESDNAKGATFKVTIPL